MSTKPSSGRRSRRGFAATLIGALILLGLLIYGLVSVLGNVRLVTDHVGPIVTFLGSGPGVLLSVAVAVILILWASWARQLRGEPNYSGAPSSRSERDRGRLQSVLRESERERERLRSELQQGERELEQLHSELREGERERERLRSELQEGKRERERLRSELREGKRERERLRSELQQSEWELEQLRSGLQEGERGLELLESENERLRAERDALKKKVAAHDSRVRLKQALNAAYWDGLHLREKATGRTRRTNRERIPSDEVAAKWAIRTNELIKEALGESEARRFLGAEGGRSGDSSATEEQKRLDGRLNRLSELIQRVDSLEPLDLQPGFNGQHRVSSP